MTHSNLRVFLDDNITVTGTLYTVDGPKEVVGVDVPVATLVAMRTQAAQALRAAQAVLETIDDRLSDFSVSEVE